MLIPMVFRVLTILIIVISAKLPAHVVLISTVLLGIMLRTLEVLMVVKTSIFSIIVSFIPPTVTSLILKILAISIGARLPSLHHHNVHASDGAVPESLPSAQDNKFPNPLHSSSQEGLPIRTSVEEVGAGGIWMLNLLI